MSLAPDIKEFKSLYKAGKPQLVWDSVAVDTETPVTALLKLAQGSEYHLLFESVERGKKSRYSIIAKDPDAVWRCIGGKPEINSDFAKNKKAFKLCKEGIFPSLRKFHQSAMLEIPDGLPPMAAGIFGYMGYDMVRHMEKLPSKNPDPIGVPEAFYMRPTVIIIFDSLENKASIITPVWKKSGEAEKSYALARARIESVKKQLKNPAPKDKNKGKKIGPFKSKSSEREYNKVVKAARDYVFSGDICQVVPSRRWEGTFEPSEFALYRALRGLNPSPYMFYVKLHDFALVGSSPEILVRLENDKVTIRPIAGTRRRGKNENEDRKLEKDLLGDIKETSEHLMLLDLGRNDVGRVSKMGTVRVTEKMAIERYSHVMHIVSNVEGKIAEGKDAIDALIAGFPAGTLTGAPKIRAMEIIDELEKEKRSFYGGTVGYFSANGNMDTCIAIRTGLIKNKKLYIQAGGGIVADSKEHDEFMETENKAKAIMKAAENAKEFI